MPVVMAIQPLPSPPTISRLLFEEPLLLAGVLIAISVVMFFIFNARGKVKQAILLSSIGLAMSVGVLFLANAVRTDREKIIAATTPLVRATAAADRSRLSPMLDDQVLLTNDQGFAVEDLPHGQTWNKEQILRRVESVLGQKYRLKPGETAIVEIQGLIDSPGRGRTQVHIRVVPEVAEFPVLSWWLIEWKQDAKGDWKVIGIQPLDLGFPFAHR